MTNSHKIGDYQSTTVCIGIHSTLIESRAVAGMFPDYMPTDSTQNIPLNLLAKFTNLSSAKIDYTKSLIHPRKVATVTVRSGSTDGYRGNCECGKF